MSALDDSDRFLDGYLCFAITFFVIVTITSCSDSKLDSEVRHLKMQLKSVEQKLEALTPLS